MGYSSTRVEPCTIKNQASGATCTKRLKVVASSAPRNTTSSGTWSLQGRPPSFKFKSSQSRSTTSESQGMRSFAFKIYQEQRPTSTQDPTSVPGHSPLNWRLPKECISCTRQQPKRGISGWTLFTGCSPSKSLTSTSSRWPQSTSCRCPCMSKSKWPKATKVWIIRHKGRNENPSWWFPRLTNCRGIIPCNSLRSKLRNPQWSRNRALHGAVKTRPIAPMS